jgi:hypothetical protein
VPRYIDPRSSDSQRQRDDALRRVSRVRRMTIVGAGALTAAVAAAVSAAAPGRTLGAKQTEAVNGGAGRTASLSSASSVAPRMPPLASAASLGLQSSDENSGAPSPSPPPQATQPAPQATQPAPQPAPTAPQAAPSGGGGGVVSGGS